METTNQETKTPLLEVKDLYVNYGMIKAIKGVSFEVYEGEIVSLIGANGAGKTTIMHAINHLIESQSGQILFENNDLTKIAPHKIVNLGLTQVPEGRRVFSELSVKDNLILGAYSRKDKKEFEETLKSVYEKFPILKERENQEAGTLSGGEQQMLAVGRALMSHPKVLLLDEPSMGLSPLYVDIIFKTIKEINEAGTTIFLVEQNAKKALSIATRAYVIETGNITKVGTGKELLNDEDVIKAYLGG
ncbi:MAG: ABC transporter ATP-binding protein [Bacilli bacterium]|nr:ABC transporter ATP-binding protein [Bacillales bacterium]MDY6142362.1 ABC transporter ATP-binding protein [Bacilli bacterium]